MSDTSIEVPVDTHGVDKGPTTVNHELSPRELTRVSKNAVQFDEDSSNGRLVNSLQCSVEFDKL